MCFSVNTNLVKEELENRYGSTFLDPDKYRPSYYYHAFGIPELPALCSNRPDKIQLLKWGLIPSWTRSTEDANEIRFKTFNARYETIRNKPSFSASFKTKRCIIPIKGFFEWQHKDNIRIPWYIYHSENEILSVAGLYDEWVENSTGEHFTTFSIITTDANDMMAVIHNSKKRMPVILSRGDEKKWINMSSELSDVYALLRPTPSDTLKAHTVGPLINDRNSDRNTPEVIRPYIYQSGSLLF
jgi:putative SOS response-associated peptidase YedK